MENKEFIKDLEIYLNDIKKVEDQYEYEAILFNMIDRIQEECDIINEYIIKEKPCHL